MDILKRWSTGSSRSKTSSEQARTPDQPPSSPGLFSRFKKSHTPPSPTSDRCAINFQQKIAGPYSPRLEYESLPTARAKATRERVNRMKRMLRSSTTQVRRASTDSVTSALIALYTDRDVITERGELASARDMQSVASSTRTVHPVAEEIMVTIDGYLQSNLPAQFGHPEAEPPSPTTSDLEGSTALDADLEGSTTSLDEDLKADSASSVYSKELYQTDVHFPTAVVSTTGTRRTATTDESEAMQARPLLPPTTEDILYISLTPIKKPVAFTGNTRIPTTCRICNEALIRPPVTCRADRAWMIHGGVKSAAHYLHVECLKNTKRPWAQDCKADQCSRCDAFMSMIRGFSNGELEGRVERMEGLGFRS
ncbi:hypothetical protein T440DRAFT_524652 [Plenodomus tracheiphilus IPT5]|uniref:Uncharacterized protein n=1 Tax=Plenodomus tracheiphilus IPT5 TaxID=1408161 RepID=A0A6A7BN69_9PLEO|nr:hypothetical protein T440DRAFT_524652 [Plenodomus tracheiphilus IPT5]